MCPELPKSIPKGKVVTVKKPRPGMNVLGTTVEIVCNTGYALSLVTNEFACQADGTWTNYFHSAECLRGHFKVV